MNQLLKRLITRNRESLEAVISKVEANIYIVGINGFVFYSKENRETYNEIKNLKIMYSIVRLIHSMGTMPFDRTRTIRQSIRGCF
jgi:exosome complex RNA-binding protein Rrp4